MALIAMFPDAEEMNVLTLLFMMAMYGYILFKASCVMNEGSEMLLLLYGPGIVGGLLIPILGAVPDCMVILLSGMGDGTPAEIQHQLGVGVGTLVGSTVMLITLPWAAGVFLGRRDYDPVTDGAATDANNKPLCTKASLTESCVTVKDCIPTSAKIMMVASLSYFIIQVPAFAYHTDADNGILREAPYALTGLIITFVCFLIYCVYQTVSAASEEQVKLKESRARRDDWKKKLEARMSQDLYQEAVFAKFDRDGNGYMDEGELAQALAALGLEGVGRRDVADIIKDIDQAEIESGKGDGKISLVEFKAAIKSWMTVQPHESMVRQVSLAIKTQKPGMSRISSVVTANGETHLATTTTPISNSSATEYGSINNSANARLIDGKKTKKELQRHADEYLSGLQPKKLHDEEDEVEEEEEEEEDEYWELSESQLKLKAIGFLACATLIVSIVSDPMVDVISTLGTRINVAPFYISFVVTPLASNASEVISGILFAKKKTTESISVSLATLHGAATMNSTLGLCIFLCLVYFRTLAWSFSAEVIAVVLAINIVGLNGLKTNIFLWQAILVLSVYPFTILFVYVCENVFGMD